MSNELSLSPSDVYTISQSKWVTVQGAGSLTIRPVGKYLLWIDGILNNDMLERLSLWPGFNSGYQTADYAVCTWDEVPDTIALGHAIVPHVFVMQINEKATMLKTNINPNAAQLETLRRLVNRVQMQSNPAIARDQQKRLT